MEITIILQTKENKQVYKSILVPYNVSIVPHVDDTMMKTIGWEVFTNADLFFF